MIAEAKQAVLEKGRSQVEARGLQLVCYDPQDKKFCAIAGDSLTEKSRLEELGGYVRQRLDAMSGQPK